MNSLITSVIKNLITTDKNLLFTKNDKEDPRLGEFVSFESSLLSADITILGYPDDDGIVLNGGRPGAAKAPELIRTYLYKMTPHLRARKTLQIRDLGNISPAIPLEERHEVGRKIITELCQKNQAWLSLGGGHDYGYCDSTAFASVFKEDAVILNFDAHLDVRPTTKGLNSGTPFYRLLTEFGKVIRFAEFGIQNQCNSQSHESWAKNKGAQIYSLDAISEKGLQACLEDFFKSIPKSKKVFISLDIDAFNSMEAPGCSQSWTTGLRTEEFLKSLHWLIANYEVCGLGIYEVSPSLDPDNRTSKLAALIAHNFIYARALGSAT